MLHLLSTNTGQFVSHKIDFSSLESCSHQISEYMISIHAWITNSMQIDLLRMIPNQKQAFARNSWAKHKYIHILKFQKQKRKTLKPFENHLQRGFSIPNETYDQFQGWSHTALSKAMNSTLLHGERTFFPAFLTQGSTSSISKTDLPTTGFQSEKAHGMSLKFRRWRVIQFWIQMNFTRQVFSCNLHSPVLSWSRIEHGWGCFLN